MRRYLRRADDNEDGADVRQTRNEEKKSEHLEPLDPRLSVTSRENILARRLLN